MAQKRIESSMGTCMHLIWKSIFGWQSKVEKDNKKTNLKREYFFRKWNHE